MIFVYVCFLLATLFLGMMIAGYLLSESDYFIETNFRLCITFLLFTLIFVLLQIFDLLSKVKK